MSALLVPVVFKRKACYDRQQVTLTWLSTFQKLIAIHVLSFFLWSQTATISESNWEL